MHKVKAQRSGEFFVKNALIDTETDRQTDGQRAVETSASPGHS